MKDYKQTADSVLQRVHEYEQQNGSSHAKVRRIGKVSVIVLPVLIIAAVSVFALKAGFGSSDISKADDTSRSDTAAGGANDPVQCRKVFGNFVVNLHSFRITARSFIIKSFVSSTSIILRLFFGFFHFVLQMF